MLLHAVPGAVLRTRTRPTRSGTRSGTPGSSSGTSVRSVKEALALADEDLDALTALLDVRLVAGDAALVDELVQRVRQLAPRRRDRLVERWPTRRGAPRTARARSPRCSSPTSRTVPVASATSRRSGGRAGAWRPRRRPRAADGRAWDRGLAILVERGYLQAGDPERLREARALLLDARVALHRVTGGRSDRLPLQEQDAVGRLVGQADADALVRGPRGGGTRRRLDHPRAVGAVAGGGGGPDPAPGRPVATSATASCSVTVASRSVSDAPVDTTTVVRGGARAAALRVPFDRPTLTRLARAHGASRWDESARAAFVRAAAARARRPSRCSRASTTSGCSCGCCPSGSTCGRDPQRNAYHRFTVDRHCSRPSPSARRCSTRRPTRWVPGSTATWPARVPARRAAPRARCSTTSAKGRAGDHSEVGRRRAARGRTPDRSRQRGTRRSWRVARPQPPAAGRHRDPPRLSATPVTISRFAERGRRRRAHCGCCTC